MYTEKREQKTIYFTNDNFKSNIEILDEVSKNEFNTIINCGYCTFVVVN